MDVLLTWVGRHDPDGINNRTGKRETGPIISLLRRRKFDVVYLLFNLVGAEGSYAPRATAVQRYCQQHFKGVIVKQVPVDVVSVVDYEEIYRLTNDACQRIVAAEGPDRHYFAFLSPGTPQMQTVWVLLVQSGLLPATMIDSTPEDLVARRGLPAWRTVDLSLGDFPQVVSPDESNRRIGILQRQIENLQVDNRRLRADLGLRTTGAVLSEDGPIPEGFSWERYRDAHERKLYVRALEQSDGNAAAAARLLGLEPHTFRAGAQRLGIRQRRRPGSRAVSA